MKFVRLFRKPSKTEACENGSLKKEAPKSGVPHFSHPLRELGRHSCGASARECARPCAGESNFLSYSAEHWFSGSICEAAFRRGFFVSSLFDHSLVLITHKS